MSIIQISKIQQRYGELVDLPQLDQAEFGFAADVNRLFIGKTTGNTENVEVLTAYSDISFNQIEGSGSTNLNINSATVANGQILSYDGLNWINKGGSAGGLINLGSVANVKLGGPGGINYVLTTDGTGNLSWTPKAFVTANIANISQANIGVVTTAEPIYLTNGSEVTITGVNGMTEVNGQSYFIGNLTNNSFELYSDITLENPVVTTGFSAYTSGGTITTSAGGSEGSANAAGVTTSVQFNTNNLLDASASFTFDKTSNDLTVSPGNIIVGNNITANGNLTVNGTANITTLTATNVSISNLQLTGSSPLTITSITTGSSATAGTITGNWTLTSGSKLQSTYADLAEYYAADKHYPAGTVLDFGGECEVTLAGIESNRIAGVVSADPAYVMNGMIHCDYPATLALQGRVQCKVKGKVYKGDMMISAGDGFAKAAIAEPKMGTVIGKALQNFDGGEGIIEVVVGRM
jgi:hypothetical protein